MTINSNAPLTTPPQSSAPSERLRYLAALWARQTGRSIVVSEGSAGAR